MARLLKVQGPRPGSKVLGSGRTHRPLSSSFLQLPYYRILNTNHKKELLRGLWVLTVGFRVLGSLEEGILGGSGGRGGSGYKHLTCGRKY